MENFFVIADEHGEFDKHMALEACVAAHHPEFTSPFGLKDGWELVNLGDKNDRGKKTYELMVRWKELHSTYEGKVHMIAGNHELMLMAAAKMDPIGTADFYIRGNGGNKTLESYSDHTKLYGKKSLGKSLQKTGHWEFLKQHIYFLETEDYFFCHSPIPKQQYRRIPAGFDFRCDINTLCWSWPNYNGARIEEERWVDENPAEGKLSVFGHIHGMREFQKLVTIKNEDGTIRHENKWYVDVPGVRQYGRSILLDTGCGCADDGYVSCLELPSMNVYNSKGETFNLKERQRDKEQEDALARLESAAREYENVP